jgi:hypothetical protein
VGLRPLACWNYGLESRRGHGCLSCECCVLSGREVSEPILLSRGVVPNAVSRVFREKFLDIHLCHEIRRISKVLTLETELLYQLMY